MIAYLQGMNKSSCLIDWCGLYCSCLLDGLLPLRNQPLGVIEYFIACAIYYFYGCSWIECSIRLFNL